MEINLVRHFMKRESLLGTASSMWDALIEEIETEQDAAEERVALMDRVHQGTVDQACPRGAGSLPTDRHRMARTERDQVQFLQTVLSGIGWIGLGDTLIGTCLRGLRLVEKKKFITKARRTPGSHEENGFFFVASL